MDEKWFVQELKEEQWWPEPLVFKFRILDYSTKPNSDGMPRWPKTEIDIRCGSEFKLHIPPRETMLADDVMLLKNQLQAFLCASDFNDVWTPTEVDFEFTFEKDEDYLSLIWKIYFYGGNSESLIQFEFNEEKQIQDLIDYLEFVLNNPER